MSSHYTLYLCRLCKLLQKALFPEMSDTDVMSLTLRSVYLFPRITKKGEPTFLHPLKPATAAERLVELRTAAGFEDRAFTAHGLVSND